MTGTVWVIAGGVDRVVKILIAGGWHSDLHEEAIFNAFKQLGHAPYKFAWHQYFVPTGRAKRLTRIFYKAQNKYMIGPAVSRLNKDLQDIALQVQPDLIFIYRGTHVFVKTIRQLKHMVNKTLIIGYNNDDPFAPQYPHWKWRHFLACVPEYDLTLAYRKHNIAEYLEIGAKRVELLRSWFIPELFVHVSNSSTLNNPGAFAVFIGHHENDNRAEIISEIVNIGFDLKIYGPYNGFGIYGWKQAFEKYPSLQKLPTPYWLHGEEYVKTLMNSKIGLCFLSKLNRDTYTRRCFEIPAAGCALFSEYSEDLAEIFQEGIEAEFFRSKEELIDKLTFYESNPDRLNKLRLAGRAAVESSGHDVLSRMRNLLKSVQPIQC